MRKIIKKMIPLWLKAWLKKQYFKREISRFKRKFSDSSFSNAKNKDIQHIEARITLHYHSLEKGLSNLKLRLGFGKNAFTQLHKAMTEFNSKNYDKRNIRYLTAISVIKNYVILHNNYDHDISEFVELFKSFLNEDDLNSGGYEIKRGNETIDATKNSTFKSLLINRHSVRDYSKEELDVSLVKDAIAYACNSPSVCNRQGWRVSLIEDKESIKKVLKIQNGLSGNGANIQYLILVLMDLRYFMLYKPFQAYVDGGIFSMNLLNALTDNGIATCPFNATMEEVIAASKKARCHDFITALPDRYDTLIGEGGNTLSGGEKQRISIARAFLKDASIILLDEATASLDRENELYIQEAIGDLVKEKTVVMIAHRLKTVEHTDQIVVIDEGRIVEQGNDKQLKAANDLYKRLYDLQTVTDGWNIS